MQEKSGSFHPPLALYDPGGASPVSAGASPAQSIHGSPPKVLCLKTHSWM